jgi:RHS repeat-associated protein
MGNFVGLGFKPGYVGYTTTATHCNYNSTIYTFYVYTNFYYLDDYGIRRTFNPNIQVAGLITLLNGTQMQCPGFTPASGWGTNIQYSADDGSGYVLILTSGAGAPAAYVYDVSNAVTNDWTDANGNSNTFNGFSNGFTNVPLIDSSGNTALIVNSNLSASPYSTTFSYPGPDGVNQNIVVTWSTFSGTGAVNCAGIPNPTPGGYRVSSIALPDGTSYGFTYEPVLGRPLTITLPTGGQISYSWNGLNAGINCLDGGSSGFTKTTPDGIWTYARSYSSTTQLWTTTITNPLGDQTVYTFGSSGTTYPGNTPLPAYEIQRKVYQKVSGVQMLLKTVVTCYNGNFTSCASTPFPSKASNGALIWPQQKYIYTYLPNVSGPSLSALSYQTPALMTEDQEFDFGASAPPTTNYVSDRKISYGTGGCITSDVTTTYGSGTTLITLAKTTAICDSYGHQTSVSRWISGSTYATTGHTYTSNGLLATSTDPRNTVTTYTYGTGSCNGAFPTSVSVGGLTTATTWDCNGEVPLTTKDTDNSTTTTYSYQDASGVGDPFWRLLQTTYPDGGQSSMQYNDTASPPNVVKSVLLDSTRTINTQINVDGLNRPVKSITSAVPAMNPATITVDITYDALGRVYQVSNPYYTTSDSTYGVTSYLYDALNRKVEQKNADGTTFRWWCYQGQLTTTGQPNCHSHISSLTAGNWVDAADENGNDWQDTSDALGRLISVEEPGGGAAGTGGAPTLETDYFYDGLGNLATVEQCGGACTSTYTGAIGRNFTYDGMSRLVSATNPESGTISYTYDGNSNVVTKTTPAVNLSSGTQTIGYCYDSLNRITYKFYSGTFNCQTPSGYAASYTYDSSSIAGAARVAGRLTDEKAYLGGTLIAERSPYQYDSMGRVTAEQQTPYKPTSATFLFLYGYDYLGNVICRNNGFAALTSTNSCASLAATASSIALRNQYDGFGRLQYSYSTLQPSSFSTAPPYLLQANSSSPVAYDAMGHLIFAQLGLGSPNAASYGIQLTRLFDKRGRLLSNVAGSLYSLGANGSAPLYDGVGNLTSYSDSVMGNTTFTYDTLNRLVGTTITTGPYAGEYGCWTYDAFGNRMLEAFTQKSTTPCAPGAPIGSPYTVTNPTPKNQVSSVVYDAAGDAISDGRNNYAYDAEGRVCAKATGLPGGGTSYTEYLYDAEGRRVAKVPGTSRSCAAPAVAPSNLYLLGLGGEQFTELNGTGSPIHSNMFLPAGMIATYDFVHGTLHIAFSDQVGTKRVQAAIVKSGTSVTATSELQFQMLPFGNDRTNTFAGTSVGSGADATEHHFTGKERDSESGNDYFPARYYTSTMGRWLSPDIVGGTLHNPQSLNRYTYVLNNPLFFIDHYGFQAAADYQCSGWLCHLEQLLKHIFPGGAGGCSGTCLSPTHALPQNNTARTYSTHRIFPFALPVVHAQAREPVEKEDDIEPEAEEPLEPLRPGEVVMDPGPPYGSFRPGNGPLDAELAKNFDWYVPFKLYEPMNVYRFSGGAAKPSGRWFSLFPPESPTEFMRDQLALPGQFNSMEHLNEVTIPAGETIFMGPAAGQFGYRGGGFQVFVLTPYP